ncbi:MAG: tRNA (guanosine(46)-N7)-methyltransferase TrmB, partial [Verrucomicrobiales bacterium]
LLFPDPWPKKRHHRRRLVTAEFLGGLADLLTPGGDFCFKTDHADYFEGALEEIEVSGLLREAGWPGEEFYPESDFEMLWRDEGREVYRARFVKT